MDLESLFINIAGDNSKLKATLAESQGALEGFGADVISWGGKMVEGLALFELVKGLGELGDKFEEIDAKIARATGTSGAALDGLTASMRAVYAQSPATAEAVTGAMDLIFQRTGTTGTQLEGLTTKMSRGWRKRSRRRSRRGRCR